MCAFVLANRTIQDFALTGDVWCELPFNYFAALQFRLQRGKEIRFAAVSLESIHVDVKRLNFVNYEWRRVPLHVLLSAPCQLTSNARESGWGENCSAIAVIQAHLALEEKATAVFQCTHFQTWEAKTTAFQDKLKIAIRGSWPTCGQKPTCYLD